jgi:hypothetical protein
MMQTGYGAMHPARHVDITGAEAQHFTPGRMGHPEWRLEARRKSCSVCECEDCAFHQKARLSCHAEFKG